jgi:hypothetical protein
VATSKQVYQNRALVSETVDWRDEPGTVLLSAQGQMYLGGLADTISGGQVEIGGTVRAMTRIDVRGGTSADGIGVKMPGTARLTTQHADGVITIAAEHERQHLRASCSPAARSSTTTTRWASTSAARATPSAATRSSRSRPTGRCASAAT